MRILSRSLSLILLALASSPAWGATPAAAGPAQLGMVLLAPDEVLSECMEVASLARWAKAATSAIESVQKEVGSPELILQATFKREGRPQLEWAGRPALAPATVARLEKAVAPIPPINTLIDLPFRIQSIREGEDPHAAAAGFQPVLETAEERWERAYAKATLGKKAQMLRSWTQEEALPVLGHLASRVDPQFKGVIASGKRMSSWKAVADAPVETAVFADADFWRGVMEMSPGDHLVVSLAPFAYVARGELDKAMRIVSVTAPLRGPSGLGAVYLGRLQERLGAFHKQLAAEVGAGIALNDKADYAGAVKVFEGILAQYPGSAGARYERFFTKLTSRAGKDGADGWEEAAREIYKADPLFSTQFHGKAGSTLGAMKARMRLRMLNESPPEAGEHLGSTAQAALQLESYGFAALVYWHVLATKLELKEATLNDEAPRVLTSKDTLVRFLYCLEKLGVTELKDNFKGDFAPAFKALDKELSDFRAQ